MDAFGTLPVQKAIVFGGCALAGIILGHVVDSEYYGPLEGFATGVIVASGWNAYLDYRALPAPTGISASTTPTGTIPPV